MIIQDLDAVKQAIAIIELEGLTVSPKLKRMVLQSEIDTEYILDLLRYTDDLN